MLEKKSLTELRGIAQNFGVKDIFTKDKVILLQEIQMKQAEIVPLVAINIPQPEYDPRLMKKIPARLSERDVLNDILAPYIARGLVVTYPDPEHWHMRFDKREDSGNMRMPPRVVMQCAAKVLNGN